MKDFYSDQGALFVKLAHDQPLPDFVKEGAFDERYDVSGLPAQSFADPHRRLFPCSTPADTFVSAAYYHAQKQADAAADVPLEANLRKFARLHGIEAEVDGIVEVAKRYQGGYAVGQAATEKTASAVSTAWSVPSSMGTWRGEGAQALQKAAEQFVTQSGNFDLTETRKVAGEFVKAAGAVRSGLPTGVLRFAGLTAPDGQAARRAVQARGLLLRERHEREKVASASLEVDVDNFTREDALKLAEWIERFDDERGLRFHYGRDLQDPMRSVFGPGIVQKKTASDDRTVQIGSRTVKVAAFDEDLGRLALGEDFTRERLMSLSDQEKATLSQFL